MSYFGCPTKETGFLKCGCVFSRRNHIFVCCYPLRGEALGNRVVVYMCCVTSSNYAIELSRHLFLTIWWIAFTRFQFALGLDGIESLVPSLFWARPLPQKDMVHKNGVCFWPRNPRCCLNGLIVLKLFQQKYNNNSVNHTVAIALFQFLLSECAWRAQMFPCVFGTHVLQFAGCICSLNIDPRHGSGPKLGAAHVMPLVCARVLWGNRALARVSGSDAAYVGRILKCTALWILPISFRAILYWHCRLPIVLKIMVSV